MQCNAMQRNATQRNATIQNGDIHMYAHKQDNSNYLHDICYTKYINK